MKNNLKGGMFVKELDKDADFDVECSYPTEKPQVWNEMHDIFGNMVPWTPYLSAGTLESLGRSDDTCWLDRNPAPEYFNNSVSDLKQQMPLVLGKSLRITTYEHKNKEDEKIFKHFKLRNGVTKKFNAITNLKSDFVIRMFRKKDQTNRTHSQNRKRRPNESGHI